MNINKLLDAHKLKPGPLREACKLVLEGSTAYAAAKRTGVDQGQLSKRLAKIREFQKVLDSLK